MIDLARWLIVRTGPGDRRNRDIHAVDRANKRALRALAEGPTSEFVVGARRLVLPSSDPANPTHPSYDVTADGRQFLSLRPAGGEERGVLVHNGGRARRRTLQEGRR